MKVLWEAVILNIFNINDIEETLVLVIFYSVLSEMTLIVKVIWLMCVSND